MRIITFFLILFFETHACFAQPVAIQNIAKQASTSKMKKNLFFLASDKMEGRLMASKGDTLASLFIAGEFKNAQLYAPYKNGRNYFQEITAYKKEDSGSLSIARSTYAVNEGWISLSEVPVNLKEVEVVFTNYDNMDSMMAMLSGKDIKNKAIVINGDAQFNSLRNRTLDSVSQILRGRGASAMVWYHPIINEIFASMKAQFLPTYQTKIFDGEVGQELPNIILNNEKINKLLEADKVQMNEDGSVSNSTGQTIFILKNRLTLIYRQQLIPVKAPNVIGLLKGRDTTLPCIVISAHHDHDGRDGKDIYYGAVDNASGTAAMIEIAAMMNKAAQKGLRPKRSIIFASFTGEERGLLGSRYYVEHPVYPINKTKAILNIDMLGRVDTFYSGKRADSNYAYILVVDTLNAGLRNALYKANSYVNLKLDTYYEQPKYMKRRLTGSDQYPFYLKGVPFIRIDCGFSVDYHKPSDTPDKINYGLLTRQTQLAFLTLWNLANE
jgi:hypothetical protein